MSDSIANKLTRSFIGEVVSTKMDKTFVAEVITVRTHPIYGKQYNVTTKYKVHDEKNEYKVGDVVEFVECRPYSKDKRWRVVKKVK